MKKQKENLADESVENNKEQEALNEEQEETTEQKVPADAQEEEEEQLELSREEELEAQVAEAKDKYLRLYSEFENFRRRTVKEKTELINTAGRKVIEDLLPVLDDFERAIKARQESGEEQDKEDKGVELIYNKFSKILESKGVKKMEIAAGDEFNDEFHEAITQIPAPDEKLAGKIVDVIEPGYFLNDTLIRFAKVVTAAKD
jgi:molecular chaperone GrpE